MSDDLPRLVRVPLHGYIDVEVDPSIEVRTSSGWDSPTEWEEMAIEAAQTALGDFFDRAVDAKVPHPTEYEWNIEAVHTITRGNLCLAEVNEIEDLGCE